MKVKIHTLIWMIALLIVTIDSQLVSFSKADPFIMILDDTPPAIYITSPTNNKRYEVSSISLSFTLTKPVSWGNKTGTGFTTGNLHSVSYYIDGTRCEQIIIDSNLTVPFTYSKELKNLPEGEHSLLITEEATAYWEEWHMENKVPTPITGSLEVIFTIDTGGPFISNLSVQNKTYATNEVSLHFNVNIPVSWMGYSLDGHENVTATDNTTLTGLPGGAHNIVVYAMNSSGFSLASRKVYFTIATTPLVSIISPKNATYTTKNISLVFTVSQAVPTMILSLNGTENAINGNTTLTGLSRGTHNLTITVKDASGNVSTSEPVYFTIAEEPTPSPSTTPKTTTSPSTSQPTQSPEPQPTNPQTELLYISAAATAATISAITITAHFKKRRN